MTELPKQEIEDLKKRFASWPQLCPVFRSLEEAYKEIQRLEALLKSVNE